MPTSHTWDPDRYLAYADERARPFADLLARVPDGPRRTRTTTRTTVPPRTARTPPSGPSSTSAAARGP